MEKLKKPKEWSGEINDFYWFKTSTQGVHYMCSFCGKESLRLRDDVDSNRFHEKNCPWMRSRIEGK
jgi:hypothetical protein